MSSPDSNAAQHVIHRLNQAWRSGRVDDLAPLFHKRAVIVDGAHKLLAEGRTACVDSYRAFVSSATVEAYEEGTHEIRLFGSAYLVTYPFEMTYRTDRGSYRESGSDALALVWEDARWEIAWRQLVWHTTGNPSKTMRIEGAGRRRLPVVRIGGATANRSQERERAVQRVS